MEDSSLQCADRVERWQASLRHRWLNGDRVVVERFVADATGNSQISSEELLDLIYSEICLREEFGESSTLAEYVSRFPALVHELQKLLEVHALLGGPPKGGSATAAPLDDDYLPGNKVPTAIGLDATLRAEPAVQQRSVSEAAATPPPCIGRYKVEYELGRGNFGSVYRAHDEDLKRDVAVKILRPERIDEAAKERFVAEGRMVAQLKHPRIVQIFDVGRHEDGRPYAVMEYVEGKSLALILAEGPPSLETSCAWTASLAETIAFAHQRGFVHRDLKPANILIDSSGSPHVLDFGLAIHESTQRNHAGETAGTTVYMSVEQVRGEAQHLDGRADIWALGVILYQMLAGRMPFSGPTFAEIRDEILHREPKPPRQIRAEVPEELERMCLRCLRKDVNQRYLTAEDLARDLRRWIARNRRGKSGPNRWLMAGAAAATLAVVIVFGIKSGSRSMDVPSDPLDAGPAGTAQHGAEAALSGKVDVFLWDPHDKARKGLSVYDERARPLRPGDQIRVKIELNRPSYVYLLWIDEQGEAQPVYPWERGKWANLPTRNLPVQRLDLPHDLDRGWRISGGPGMETFVLLARETPLPKDVHLEQLVSGIKQQVMSEPTALAEFERGSLLGSRHVELTNAQPIDDSVLQTQELLANRLGEHFSLIRAICFANRGN